MQGIGDGLDANRDINVGLQFIIVQVRWQLTWHEDGSVKMTLSLPPTSHNQA